MARKRRFNWLPVLIMLWFVGILAIGVWIVEGAEDEAKRCITIRWEKRPFHQGRMIAINKCDYPVAIHYCTWETCGRGGTYYTNRLVVDAQLREVVLTVDQDVRGVRWAACRLRNEGTRTKPLFFMCDPWQ